MGHCGNGKGKESPAVRGFGLCVEGRAGLSQRIQDFEPEKS